MVEDKPGFVNNDLNLGNLVSSCALECYNHPEKVLKDKQLTKYRSAKNGYLDKFTVLASLVAIIPKESEQDSSDEGEPEPKRRKVKLENALEVMPLTLTTGLKTMPNERIQKLSNGRLIHDCHAEILSIRLLNLIILNEIAEIVKGRTSTLLRKADMPGKYTLINKKTQFALYISEIPCGDCSIDNTKHGSLDKTEWEDKGTTKTGVARGRNNFDKVGIVRTKPGRSDSLVSYSKSCSDKLCLKQFTSLLSCHTYDLIEDHSLFYLKYLVLPEAKINTTSIQRCFYGRFIDNVEERHLKNFKNLSVLPTDIIFETKNTPCNTSILYSPMTAFLQVLNNGIKDGCSSKNGIKASNQSEISRESLMKKAILLNRILASFENYQCFKESLAERRSLKLAVKNGLGGWGKSSSDNFSLHFGKI
ncbi:hypothetical protein CANARDRAFT_29552 [[Candida] arabinofermentans NRRL YB-2248]|uniref:A to I editase domain-containing protein n=1 Tax=[Candida] arabinofermentans NRRL YB-2248 TaxID=983967 RepID=A0A1E4SXA5_9ASCO|nr:hypothetical protein CANARDRAFT_29552 [[Candida] arabinofermentans NRRL YB-2248]